jgi:hypothetical protein
LDVPFQNCDVKLSSAVAAILVGGMKCRTQFWKGNTQGSFQKSLVEIGSVVSEKIFFKFHLGPYGKFTYTFSPHKPLGQLQQNFGGMILGCPLSKLCSVIPTSNQDGRQAKNRKKGR